MSGKNGVGVNCGVWTMVALTRAHAHTHTHIHTHTTFLSSKVRMGIMQAMLLIETTQTLFFPRLKEGTAVPLFFPFLVVGCLPCQNLSGIDAAK